MKKLLIVVVLILLTLLIGCDIKLDEYETKLLPPKTEDISTNEFPYKISIGRFVGLNYYVGIKCYHVILINGVEVETIGITHYMFMGERCVVLEIEGQLYSMPLRDFEVKEYAN